MRSLSMRVAGDTRIYSLLFHSRPQSPSFLGHVVRYKLNRVALGTRMPFFWSIFPQRSTKDFPSPQTNIFKFQFDDS